jgi:hypothetical protein
MLASRIGASDANSPHAPAVARRVLGVKISNTLLSLADKVID